MSDDAQSSSDSESVDLSTTGLIATRAKRSTAGNLYATLRQNLDDEELQKELLAEDEEDVGDYEGSDKAEDDDEAMDSSSDDEDAGPPKEGADEELEGEKELKRAERAEAKKRKRMEAAKMRIPGWQKRNKRVKLADDVKTEDGSTERPKKKSERSNWLPSETEAPTRQSSRASAVQSRELTHASLKVSAERSERQKKLMQRAQERERLRRRTDLTQEDRLAKAMKIEKETAREFGRWEREEAERQRIREEQLAAKRRRGIEGPHIKYWSGSVLWEGDKIRIRRLHGSQNVEKIEDEPSTDIQNVQISETTTSGKDLIDNSSISEGKSGITVQNAQEDNQDSVVGPAMPFTPSALSAAVATNPGAETILPTESPTTSVNPAAGSANIPSANTSTAESTADPSITASAQAMQEQQKVQAPCLDGIGVYAAQSSHSPNSTELQGQTATHSQEAPPFQYFPSAPLLNVPAAQTQSTASAESHLNLSASSNLSPQESSHVISFLDEKPAPPPPAIPELREQAQRFLVILDQFEKLEVVPTTTKRGAGKAAKDVLQGPSPLASTVAPLSYPTFTADESRYLSAKMRKRGAEQQLPPAPVRMRCALTSWPAKFRDPKTGLPYADLQAYKLIQRMLAGGCAWSSVLGAWVGPAYGEMGRPARGVPDGFGAPSAPKKATDDAQDIKIETAG